MTSQDAREIDVWMRGWMGIALEEADQASDEGEVPVGCVLVASDGTLLARAHNLRERLRDPTAHAEVVALREAAQGRPSWRLDGAVAFVTLEPCLMCAGAFLNARVSRIVYGCDDPKAGAVATLYAVGQDRRLNHQFEVVSGVLQDESKARLRTFFERLRKQGKK